MKQEQLHQAMACGTGGPHGVTERGRGACSPGARRCCWSRTGSNPLLPYEGFAPEATGVKILLSHVTEHRPVHDLASLEALAQALAG